MDSNEGFEKACEYLRYGKMTLNTMAESWCKKYGLSQYFGFNVENDKAFDISDLPTVVVDDESEVDYGFGFW